MFDFGSMTFVVRQVLEEEVLYDYVHEDDDSAGRAFEQGRFEPCPFCFELDPSEEDSNGEGSEDESYATDVGKYPS